MGGKRYFVIWSPVRETTPQRERGPGGKNDLVVACVSASAAVASPSGQMGAGSSIRVGTSRSQLCLWTAGLHRKEGQGACSDCRMSPDPFAPASVQTLQMMVSPVGFPFVAGVVGLLIGSFLNVVVLRGNARHAWRLNKTLPKPAGIASERSRCPSCGHQITWYENIPVLSWIFLHGKCSSCKAPISCMYPLVEAVTCLATVAIAVESGFGTEGVAAIAATWLFIAIATHNVRVQTTPLWLTRWLVFPVALQLVHEMGMDLATGLTGFALGAGAGALLQWVRKQPARDEGLIFLLAAAGAFVGPLYVLLLGAAASGFGRWVGAAIAALTLLGILVL